VSADDFFQWLYARLIETGFYDPARVAYLARSPRRAQHAKTLFEHLPGHVIIEISHEYSLWAERSKHETVT